MSAFELLTAMSMGMVGGVAVAVVRRWRGMGGVQLFVGGALGGIVGGLIGFATSAVEGPAWGELAFHPVVLVASLVAGAGVVALLHAVGDATGRRQTARARRPRG